MKYKKDIIEYEEKALLYGIQDFLPGNEDKINFCFPVLKASNSDFLKVVSINWNLKLKKGIFKINNLEVMDEKITKIESEQGIFIESLQMPILWGPLFIQRFNNIYSGEERNFVGKKYLIQNDFQISLGNINLYEHIRSKIRNDSKDIFDNELTLSKCKFISEKAENALELLISNPLTSKKDYYLRMLARYKIKSNDSNYNKFLELGAIDLDKSNKFVNKLCEDYLSNKIN